MLFLVPVANFAFFFFLIEVFSPDNFVHFISVKVVVLIEVTRQAPKFFVLGLKEKLYALEGFLHTAKMASL